VGLQTVGPTDLEVEHVSKHFGGVAAVDEVSLTVQRGEFYSLLGPSGCGKTTTLRLIAGFELPDHGRILLAGSDITHVPPNRRRVNTVFQHYALFPHMTVEENVAYGLKFSQLSRPDIEKRLQQGLETVRLESLKTRYPRELSGGQQQRVALARALVNEPQVLLLDEPLAALDLKLRKAMQQELKKLQERVGITFVYVTHDQEEALTLSDRIAVMNEGHLLQEGTPEEIYERPRTRFVADFIGQTNFFKGVVEETGDATVVREESGLVLHCAPAEFARPGMNVSVSVRPERIAPRNGTSPDINVLTGRLVRQTYLGDLVQYHLSMPGSREIVVQRQNDRDDPAAQWRMGETVDVTWDQNSALVVTDDGGAIADEDARRLLASEESRS
jgi:spermidine/putrescine transport system ATP-binding protein